MKTKLFTGDYYSKDEHTKNRLTLRMHDSHLAYYKAIAESRGIPLNALISEAMIEKFGEPATPVTSNR